MTITASDALPIQGVLQTKASYPAYTRMTTPLSLPAHYVEFLTTDILSPQLPLPPSTGQVWVGVDTQLYFSDYETPNTAPALAGLGLRFVPPPAQVPASGLVLLDGSPVVPKLYPGTNTVSELAATDKGGTAYDLALTVSNVQIAGRTQVLSNWVFSHAQLTVANGPSLEVGVGFSPTDLLVVFFATYQNIRCLMQVDLAPALDVGGYAQLTREIAYYNETVSTLFVDMPAGAGAPMRLPTPALHQFLLPLVTLSPALAYIAGPLEKRPQPEPIAALGSVDVQVNETQAGYVNRGTAVAGPALAALLAELGVSAFPGFSDLAQWLGWSLTEFGQTNAEAAFTSAYVAYEQWRAKQGAPGTPFHPLRTVLGSDGGFAQQAVDKLFDLAGGK